eukprot:1187553-Prorocentrum_minimum.AAC.3
MGKSKREQQEGAETTGKDGSKRHKVETSGFGVNDRVGPSLSPNVSRYPWYRSPSVTVRHITELRATVQPVAPFHAIHISKSTVIAPA